MSDEQINLPLNIQLKVQIASVLLDMEPASFIVAAINNYLDYHYSSLNQYQNWKKTITELDKKNNTKLNEILELKEDDKKNEDGSKLYV